MVAILLKNFKNQLENEIFSKIDLIITYRVIHERSTSEFLFCRNQQYQWQ
jgi:hypothetical protein